MEPDNINSAGVPNMQNQPSMSGQPVGQNAMEQALAETSASPAPTSAPMCASAKNSGKGMLYGMIIFMVLAIGGIGFGIWAMMDGNSKVANLDKQVLDLKKQNAELLEKVANMEGTKQEDENEEEGNSESDGYFVLDELGIKIKKTDTLPDMVVNVVGDGRFEIKESVDAVDGDTPPTVVSFMKVNTCNDDELTLGYGAKINIDGVCYIMGEIYPYGSDPEYPLTPFLTYVRDAANYSAV